MTNCVIQCEERTVSHSVPVVQTNQAGTDASLETNELLWAADRRQSNYTVANSNRNGMDISFTPV